MTAAGTSPRDPLDAIHLGPEAVRRYLRAHGLAARRSLSQNFLADGAVLEAIVTAAGPAPGEHFLEIGPGIGILTGALLSAGARVTAVELDSSLAAHMRSRFADALELGRQAPDAPGALRLVEGDVLDVPLAHLVDDPYQVAANLPYHITSPVLHRLLGAHPRPQRFVLMLQREVAERIAAAPGAMSYLSVFVQYHAAVRLVRVVPSEAFEPAPQVESAVLAGETKRTQPPQHGEEALWRLVQAGFRERRKMIRNVLSRQLPVASRARLDQALERSSIDPQRRPQTLALAEWLALADALGPLDA